jgi:hypothetical protein
MLYKELEDTKGVIRIRINVVESGDKYHRPNPIVTHAHQNE